MLFAPCLPQGLCTTEQQLSGNLAGIQEQIETAEISSLMDHSSGVLSLFSMQTATVGLPSLYRISRSNTSFFHNTYSLAPFL